MAAKPTTSKSDVYSIVVYSTFFSLKGVPLPLPSQKQRSLWRFGGAQQRSDQLGGEGKAICGGFFSNTFDSSAKRVVFILPILPYKDSIL